MKELLSQFFILVLFLTGLLTLLGITFIVAIAQVISDIIKHIFGKERNDV
jgi:hypothetical protein